MLELFGGQRGEVRAGDFAGLLVVAGEDAGQRGRVHSQAEEAQPLQQRQRRRFLLA